MQWNGRPTFLAIRNFLLEETIFGNVVNIVHKLVEHVVLRNREFVMHVVKNVFETDPR